MFFFKFSCRDIIINSNLRVSISTGEKSVRIFFIFALIMILILLALMIISPPSFLMFNSLTSMSDNTQSIIYMAIGSVALFFTFGYLIVGTLSSYEILTKG